MRGVAGGLLALTLLGAAGAATLATTRVYRVQPGDSLYSLARKNGTTVEALQQLNGLQGSVLRAGQAIQLPGGSTAVSTQPARLPASVPASPVQTATPEVYQSGMAVYYSGRADPRTVLTAAHLSLPFGTWVEVKHARTGRTVLVLINDRGPFGRSDRVIDLSESAARALGIMGEGVAPVTLRIARAP